MLAEQSGGHELIADALNLSLARYERRWSGVHRIATEYQIVRVFGCGAEDKSRRTVRLNDNCLAGFLEYNQFARGHRLGCA